MKVFQLFKTGIAGADKINFNNIYKLDKATYDKLSVCLALK